MKTTRIIFCAIFLCGAFAAGSLPVFAQKGNAGDERRVKFGRGKTSTVISGKIKDFLAGPIYLVGVGGNQQMSIRLLAASGEVEIYINTPDNQDTPILTRQEKSWSGTITKMGDCEIIINPKRDNFTYKIEISVH